MTLVRRKPDDHSLTISLQPVVDVSDLCPDPFGEYENLKTLRRIRRLAAPRRPRLPTTTTTAHDSTALFTSLVFFASLEFFVSLELVVNDSSAATADANALKSGGLRIGVAP